MKRLYCAGSPFDIGFQHGKLAQTEIGRCVAFYADLFVKSAGLHWDEVCSIAAKFNELLGSVWPEYVEEMQGKQGLAFPSRPYNSRERSRIFGDLK